MTKEQIRDIAYEISPLNYKEVEKGMIWMQEYLIQKASEHLKKELYDIDDENLNKYEGLYVAAKDSATVRDFIQWFRTSMRG